MVCDIYYKTNIMKERLEETNRMRRLMGLPLITEQTDNKTENYTVKKGDSLSLIAKSFNEDKKCKIPDDGNKNAGSLYESGLLSDSARQTIGLDEATSTIDFAHDDWKASGQAICAKHNWAKTHGVVWDGVSNYNDC